MFRVFWPPPVGPVSGKISVPGHSQNLPFGMNLSTYIYLFGKIAEFQFELADFEKFRLKDATRPDHTRSQLTTNLPLQRNDSSTKLLYELYLGCWAGVGWASGVRNRALGVQIRSEIEILTKFEFSNFRVF